MFFRVIVTYQKVISRNLIGVSKAMLNDNENARTEGFLTDVILVLLLSMLSRFHVFPQKL